MNHLALIGPPHLTDPRTQAAQRVHRIGRGQPAGPVVVSFDPADQRSCRDLLAWFERGGQRGTTLLIDDWKLCETSDPGLAEAVRWIAATAQGVQVIITARTVEDLPGRLLVRTEVLDFLALHGMPNGFDKQHAWQQRPQRDLFDVPVGINADGLPIEINIQPQFMNGMGPHGEVVAPASRRGELLRAIVLGEMVRHSPDLLQVVLVDFHGTGVFTGLDAAPHTYASFSGLAQDDALTNRIYEALAGEASRRQEILAHGNFKNTWDYRKSRQNGADLDPLPQLLICVDGATDLAEAHQEFLKVLMTFGRVGRSYGTHLLLSGTTTARDSRGLSAYVGYTFELTDDGWSRRLYSGTETFELPANLDELVRTLPNLMAQGEPDRGQMIGPPLWELAPPTLDEFPIYPEHNTVAVGLRDAPFEHRVSAFWASFPDGKHGAIVGKPGSGRTTAINTLAAALIRTYGSLDGYHLADGQRDGFPEDKHVIVTAETWDQVPQFIRENLAWGVELKLRDPAGSIVDERRQANLPDRPGLGLCAIEKLQVRIATS